MLTFVLLAGMLGGCAYSGRKGPVAPSAEPTLSDDAARNVIGQWQARLGGFVADDGGDPAALARLPALRSPAAPRPGRIVFTVEDVFASVPERDGYDVAGLLVGKRTGAAGPMFVFIVGTVARSEFRPVAVVDVRIAALSIRDGAANWDTGAGDAAALARYRARADASAAPRFPADRDRFRLLDCAQAICVEEVESGARWTLYAGSTSTTSGIGPATTSR
jgi:hypothetical protein